MFSELGYGTSQRANAVDDSTRSAGSLQSETKSTRPRIKLASLSPAEGLGPIDGSIRQLRTAVYDIAAKVVYLPNGERLEAHSGLGRMMDDPRYVHVRMRGATPPNVYDLGLRESPFHGVQAIRLTPTNGKGMFGRAGILAHTYMLGENGQSNGCVSLKDYDKFLQAFRRGEIDRLIVVTHLDKAPIFASLADAKGTQPPPAYAADSVW